MIFSRHGFEAEVISDCVNPDGDRITTIRARYPRFIHSEVMTHRAFSRNAASSRAIPVKKIIEQVRNDPAMPIFWGKNQPGMQAAIALEGLELERAQYEWLVAKNRAVHSALEFEKIGLHKQIANRILEPWMWMTTIITSTDWDHFFHLRRAAEAQPEFHLLADLIFEAREASTPDEIQWGEWSLPYVRAVELTTTSLPDLLKFSTARCARVSYLNHDGTNPNPEKDVELHDKLIKAPHASPFEHPAMAAPGHHANFTGFRQYRASITREHIKQKPYRRMNNGIAEAAQE